VGSTTVAGSIAPIRNETGTGSGNGNGDVGAFGI